MTAIGQKQDRTNDDILPAVSSDFRGRSILLVEDNELNRDILSSFLEEKFDVFLAENGEEGLELLSEHYRELSVVLLVLSVCLCVMDLNSSDAETQINFCQPYRLSL